MKKLLIILALFLLLNGVFGYHSEKINISETFPNKTITFKIDKIKNYTYMLSFTHYGNLQENMNVNIYLNEHLIYKINDSNDASPAYMRNVSIDITNYLVNGVNTLKIEGIDLVGGNSYHPYYVLKNIYINEPIKIATNGKFELLTVLLIMSGILVYKGWFNET
jgi:hypothetical protein